MNALVTGGGGFLGLYIVEQLVARGDRVRVLCRGQYPRLAELGVEVQTADIRDRQAVVQACAGQDAVFHVAAVSGIWGAWSYYHDINTRGTEYVLEGCRVHHVPKLVYTSSPSVVFDGHDHQNADEQLPYADRFLCAYPWSKAIAEKQVLQANSSGLATTALRPHLIWGPRDNHLIPRLIARARAGQLKRVGRGENQVSVSYVENAAAAHLAAADRLQPGSPVAGQAYFINEPESVNLWGWIDELLENAGLPRVQKAVPAAVAYAAGGLLEAAHSTFRLRAEPRMTRFLALQLSRSHHYSVQKAQRDFGYSPTISIKEGIQRMTAELRGS